MPYIDQKERKRFDPEIDFILQIIRENITLINEDGCVNYIITRIIDGVYSKGDYFHYNRALGVLEAVKQEVYRKRIAVYEDEKEIENGTIWG
jgi:hypothetical protein